MITYPLDGLIDIIIGTTNIIELHVSVSCVITKLAGSRRLFPSFHVIVEWAFFITGPSWRGAKTALVGILSKYYYYYARDFENVF